MFSQNLINVESHVILDFLSRVHKNKVGRLSHPVNHNPYGVMLSPSLWKTNHEVHINSIRFLSRNLNNMSKTARIKMFFLSLLTIRTVCHIFCNVLLHDIPSMDLLKIIIHLGGTRMYGIYGTKFLYIDLGSQIIHIWWTQPVLVPRYVVISKSKRVIHLNQH